MAGFQSITIGIAMLLFVLTLIVIGYLMFQSSSSGGTAPTPTNCPNLWEDPNGDGSKCINSHLLGTCLVTPPIFTSTAPIWESQTNGNPGAIAQFRNGNLQVMDASGNILFPTSGTTNPPTTNTSGTQLQISGETLCILPTGGGNPLWCASLNHTAQLGSAVNPSTMRGKNQLLEGDNLTTGEALFSKDGKYQVLMQTDGNLVLTGWDVDITPTTNNWINLKNKTACEKYQWSTGCDLTWDLITTNPSLCAA